MASSNLKLPAGLAFLASALGLVFATYSSLDYAAHLDRGIHDLHCSIVPGMPPTDSAEACRAAMYSPYSAIMKTALWGGVPIALFAMGAFAFFASFSAYFFVQNDKSGRLSRTLFSWTSVTPLLVSLLMLTISLTQLGSLCRVCLGIYIASALLAIGGIAIGRTRRAVPARSGSLLWAMLLLLGLGVSSALPALAYAATAPDHSAYLRECGTLPVAPEAKHELMPLLGSTPRRDALFFEDPLCPTCRAFHTRLAGEGILEKLNAQVVLFPLDSECNWMLGEPLHPGACQVSRALLCAEDPKAALEWAFDEQEKISEAGKAGPQALGALLSGRFGPGLKKCMDSAKTKTRLNKHLHYAAENNIPLSTPQMYLGTHRVCDEDTDMGLSFTMKQLAPELVQ
jgi:uncharacterized membrane protein